MSHSSDSSGVYRSTLDGPGRVVFAGTLVVLTSGVLAFGAPYPWAYRPLAIGAALVGGLGWFASRRARLLPDQRHLFAALIVIAVAVTLQLVPMPARAVDALSPSNAFVLQRIDLAFGVLASTADGAVTSWRPLSIDPAGTAIGAFLFGAFTVLLAGLMRHCNRFGIRRFAAFFVGLGTLVALIGIVQKALLGDNVAAGMKIYGLWTPFGRLSTPFGPFVNKNHFAGWMLMALPTTLGYLLAQAEVGFQRVRPGWRSWFLWLSSPEGGRLQMAAFAAVVMGVSLMMTMSRSGIACFGVALALAAIAAARGQRSALRRLAVVVGFAGLLGASLLWADSNVAARFSSHDASLQLRRAIWSDTRRLIADFPLTGSGLNTFAGAMRVYQTSFPDQTVREAHNDYLQLIAEGGLLVGTPVVVAMALVVIGVHRRFASRQDDPPTSWLRFGAATGLLAIALQSVVEFSLQMPGIAVTLVVLLSMALHSPAANVPSRRRG